MARGAFGRVADIVRADVDDLLSRMEDPKKMIRQMIAEMEDTVNEAVTAVGAAVANERLLERRVETRRAEVITWDRKAEQAVVGGEDELARLALQKKVAVEAEVKVLENALEESGRVTAQLKQQLDRLKGKLQEARARQRTLIVKQSATRQHRPTAQARVREDAFEQFDALCERVARDEATAEVYEEITGSKPSLDDRYEELAQKKQVEQQLQVMKEKLGDAKSESGQKEK